MIVVIGRSELFTEQTSLAALPVMTGEASVAKVARLWGIVYTANLVGAAAFAGITVVVGPAMGTIEPQVPGEIARDVVRHPWWLIVASGMLAGWLMGLLSWLVAAGRDTISQLVMIWLITMAIGLGHFHHAVLGSVEMFAGLFSDPSITGRDFVYAVGWTTLGNAVGGPLFILLKYGLARRGSEEDA
jgi:formate/nitrite transporter FocA (FNT family)